MTANLNMDRRNFLKWSGALTIGFAIPSVSNAKTKAGLSADVVEGELNAFIIITKDNKITLINPRPDMGQGSSQAMPMLIAEELEVRLEDITHKWSNGTQKFGGQTAGGSTSVRSKFKPLREAGAQAREMLTKAAANRWGVTMDDCYAENGQIINKKSKASLTYGELVEDASKLEVPKSPKLKDPKDFKLIGKSLPRLDVPTRVNGSAKFGIDAKIDGMLYAVVLHAPMIHGKVRSIDDSQAMKVAGVKKVVQIERAMPHKKVDAVAIVATNTWAATEGRKVLNVHWDNGDLDQVSTQKYFDNCHKSVKNLDSGYTNKDAKGNVKDALAKSKKTLEAVYETPFTAHAPMEPENCTAWVQGDKVELWVPSQGPDWMLGYIAQHNGFKPENIKINIMLLGGAFGRKAYFDYVCEAIDLSKKLGAPVKLTWTREDDLMQGPVRPGMVYGMRGGLDENNNLVAYENRIAGGSLGYQLFNAPVDGPDDSWAEGVKQSDSPYGIPNRAQIFHLEDTTIPIVWWRSVYTSTNSFAHECFIDEMAHAAGKDPLQFRLDMLKGSDEKEKHHTERYANVLKFVAEKAGYGKPLPAGQAQGIAVAHSFGSTAAYVITVSKKGNGVKIEKVVGAIDCGIAVNPDNVLAQTEGNVVMGLSAALKASITMANGTVQETNFHQFNPLRINETPRMELYVVPSTEDPGGAGEPGLPPVAPALCNAIFNLTKKRVRRLPFDLANLG
jgi:isoquinoline 1-oxidoreductase subunit beta